MREKITAKLTVLENEWQELMHALEKYSDADLNHRPTEDKWSVIQIMHHLKLSEKASLKYCIKKLSYNPKLKKAGLRAMLRRNFVQLYLASPIKVSAPKHVATPMLPTSDSFENIRKEWTNDRAELSSFFESIAIGLLQKEVYKHPLVGRLTLSGMLDFFTSHFRRHRKQITRTLNH